MKKIVTVIGARPQFIKASVVSHAFADVSDIQEILLHTGQHFDENMSKVFFEELHIPVPQYMFDINGGTHGNMTGRMLIEIEKVLLAEKPDAVLVYGDTNSTLAGALAASKLNIPIIHVEAGLRSFNKNMPEEINRILTDNISSVLFCPTKTAVENLQNEGFGSKDVLIEQVGDVMLDSTVFFKPHAVKPKQLNGDEDFYLATIHRAENTDDVERLTAIVNSLNELHKTRNVVIPLHPRTARLISAYELTLNVNVIEPVSYLEMLWLLDHCRLVVTDSGGLQKEAFFFQKPCVTVRDQTEWVELVDIGANVLAKASKEDLISKIETFDKRMIPDKTDIYGGGEAVNKIVSTIIGTGL